MNCIQKGAYQAVRNCVRLRPGEKVVMITDYATKHIASAIESEVLKVSPDEVEVFLLEKYGERPDDGSCSIEFPSEIGAALKNADVSFYAVNPKKGELKTLVNPMLDVVNSNKKLRHAHMPEINEQLMCMGMCTDYDKVQELSKKVFDLVKDAEYARVTAPAGTNFIAEFSHDYKWQVDDGIVLPGRWSNLPDGEVFTCPKNLEGVIVVDGIIGDYFSEKYGLLDKTPVTLDIMGGRVADIFCKNKRLQQELLDYTFQDENSNRIGEFGIGTNIGVDRIVGNLTQDEKCPGVHAAIGDSYSEATGTGWKSDFHADLLPRYPTIEVDGEIIMRNGKFLV